MENYFVAAATGNSVWIPLSHPLTFSGTRTQIPLQTLVIVLFSDEGFYGTCIIQPHGCKSWAEENQVCLCVSVCVCVHELACICSLKGNASFDFLLITQHALCAVVNCQGPLFFSMENMAGMEWKHILLSSPLSDDQSIVFLSACLTCHILFPQECKWKCLPVVLAHSCEGKPLSLCFVSPLCARGWEPMFVEMWNVCVLRLLPQAARGEKGVSVSSLIMYDVSMCDHCQKAHNIHTNTQIHTDPSTHKYYATELWCCLLW